MVTRQQKISLAKAVTLLLLSGAIFIYSIWITKMYFLSIFSIFTACIAVIWMQIVSDKIQGK